MPPVTLWYADRAWLSIEDGLVSGVLLTVDGDQFAAVETGLATPPPEAVRVPGLLLPGLVNAHSHAFHRALRSRTHRGAGDFWSWREQMYAVAATLSPGSYHELARATYAEMALAGITTVVEFHYLHHDPAGRPYRDRNAMGHALVAAAAEAGVRLVLLDTCYLQSDVDGTPLSGPQIRFGDGTPDAWASRATAVTAPYVGAAIHSVRGCPPEAITAVAAWARGREVPLHLHLSEQRRENEACVERYGLTPTALLDHHGALGPTTTAVHATHLTEADRSLLARTGTGVCMCPTTEQDLADGVGPAAALARDGVVLSLGSDSHAVIDLFAEARAVELDERLATERRGHHGAASLLSAATAGGAAAAGLAAGRIEPGACADFVALRLDSVRLAGAAGAELVAAVVFAATAADVSDVVVGGRRVVAGGVHQLVGDVPRALAAAIAPLYRS